jgi:hypothetical protein
MPPDKIKSRVLKKNKVYTYGTSVFVPDDNNPVSAAEMCTNSNEH